MTYSLILTLHMIVCVFVILAVLLQSGKGAGFAGFMGSGGGDALFSAPSGSSLVRKITTGLAVAFFTTSLALTYLGARRGLRSVTNTLSLPPLPETSAPTAPAPTAPTGEEKK